MLSIGSAGATDGFCCPTPACRQRCTVLIKGFAVLVSLRGASTACFTASLLDMKATAARTAKTGRGRSNAPHRFVPPIIIAAEVIVSAYRVLFEYYFL